jgi:hypothetical protein
MGSSQYGHLPNSVLSTREVESRAPSHSARHLWWKLRLHGGCGQLASGASPAVPAVAVSKGQLASGASPAVQAVAVSKGQLAPCASPSGANQ